METSLPSRKRQRSNSDHPTRSWFVFPPKRKASFHVGQSVLLTDPKKVGLTQGSIVSIDPDKRSIDFRGISSGEITTVNEKEVKRLLLTDLNKRSVLVTPETNFFRQLAANVFSSDRVLEIGFSSGETSKLLWAQHCQSWIGFDTSEEMLQKCQEAIAAQPSCTSDRRAVIVNPLVDPAKARKEARSNGNVPNVIFLDIGGNRELLNVLRMISWVLEEFDPRFVAVKSRELVQAINGSDGVVDDSTGLVENGEDWFQLNRQNRALPKHPLKAALVMSPIDSTKPICRYHNYHKNGCKRGDKCSFDHEYCHACLRKGHVASNCELLKR